MELLDIYGDDGKPTNRVVVRGDKNELFDTHEHIAVSIIFIENSNNEFLIQKTSDIKGENYSSTGGHVNSGETPVEGIRREVKEEIGINIDDDNIIFVGFYQIGMPLRFLFYLKKDINIDSINIQKEEVSEISYKSIEEINNLIDNNLMIESHAILFKKIIEFKKDNNI